MVFTRGSYIDYFELLNFYTIHFSMFLNDGIGIFLYVKHKNMSFSIRIVDMRDFKNRVNLKIEDHNLHIN